MSIGEALAAARRRAGLTVSQVSERTRVREAIIRGIENDDYSGCGGDFYARGHIRGIAKVIGVDPEPLIREYNATQRTPQPIIDADVVLSATPVETHRRRRLTLAAALVVVVVTLGLVAYHLLAGSRQGATVAASAQAHRAAQRHGGHGRPNQPPKTGAAANASASLRHSPRATVAAVELTPVSAVAFGPDGAGQGDNPQFASLAIDGNPATAWRTDWYTTARFGNLYPATGLLVDMGRPVTIIAAQITLGSASGAGFQLRVGNTPALAGLLPVAGATDAGGVVRLRLTTPAHGRYLLIWFTQLPPDPAGTFQVSVPDVRVDGQP